MFKIGVVTNSSDDDTASFESSLNLNNLKKCKKQQTRKKKLDFNQMTYSCGWDECDYESSSIKDYFLHVSGHVDHLWVEEWQGNKDSRFCYIKKIIIIHE